MSRPNAQHDSHKCGHCSSSRMLPGVTLRSPRAMLLRPVRAPAVCATVWCVVFIALSSKLNSSSKLAQRRARMHTKARCWLAKSSPKAHRSHFGCAHNGSRRNRQPLHQRWSRQFRHQPDPTKRPKSVSPLSVIWNNRFRRLPSGSSRAAQNLRLTWRYL